MIKAFDAIVLGSGGGLKIVRACAERGLRVALVEEGAFGGTCLNRGCIPSKMMIYPAARRESVRSWHRLGLRLDGSVQADFARIVADINREIDATSRRIGEDLEHLPGVTVFRGPGRFVGDKLVEACGTRLSAPAIFICTGSRPQIPPLQGLAGSPYMTSREALRNRVLPQRLIVMGAGYIAAELGFAYAGYGTEVEFLVRSRFLRAEDVEIAREFERIFCARHVVHEGFHPAAVHYADGEFCVRGTAADDPCVEAKGDALLIATGVVPETDRLDLAQTGVACRGDGWVVVDDRLRTTCEGVYALGDVLGRYLYRHTVNYEAEYLIRGVLDGKDPGAIAYGPVPHAVFADPEIAGVGETEASARAKGIPLVIGRATYADSTPGMAHRSEYGLCKVLVHAETRAIIGAHILGEEAATMIHLFVAAMLKQATLDDMLRMIFIHPAMPEIARDAVRDAGRQSPG